MYKRIINLFTIILVFLLISLSVLVMINFTQIRKEFNIGAKYSLDNPPNYHFMVIVDGTDANYVKEIESGVLNAVTEYDVVYEIWHFQGERKEEEIIRQFDIAIESDVDGIIIQAFKDERFATLLSKSNDRNVPVTTIGTDIPSYEKVSFLSYNGYAIGSRIGNLLETTFIDKSVTSGTIVLLQGNEEEQDMGLAIKEKIADAFVIKPELVDYEGEDTLNAEGVTRRIINQYDDLEAIICSSGEETLGVIQALKDTNKLNEVVVIGNDDYTEILDYIRRGIVLATVVADNERLGYEAISHLVDFKNDQFVSQYKDIQVKIIVKETIESYMLEVGDRYEAK